MPMRAYSAAWRRNCKSTRVAANQRKSAPAPMRRRISVIHSGPRTGAATRMKMNAAPQMAASAARRAASAARTWLAPAGERPQGRVASSEIEERRGLLALRTGGDDAAEEKRLLAEFLR